MASRPPQQDDVTGEGAERGQAEGEEDQVGHRCFRSIVSGDGAPGARKGAIPKAGRTRKRVIREGLYRLAAHP